MKAVLVRPKFDDATEYTCAFAEEILQWCNQAGFNVAELAEGDAIKTHVVRELSEGADLLIFYDHGSEDALIGQDERPVIDLSNCQLLAGKETYTLACLSAKSLGVEVWRRGGKYWGYKEVVSFTTDSLAEFQEAFNCGFYYRFVEGDTCESSLSRAKLTFDNLVTQLVSAGKTLAAICMRQNRDSLRYYDTSSPDTGCLFRKTLISIFGMRGWAIQSPLKIFRN